MKDIEFPIFSTKTSEGKTFDLTDANRRREYFEYKAGPEIKKLQDYLKNNTFIVYLLGKKSSGKGTYSKMFKEIISPERVEHLSVGDLIRSFDEVLKDPVKKQELVEFLQKKYRGPKPLPELITAMEERSTKVLLPSELILALVEKEITRLGKKAIFIDGFPRDVDQVSYSLFFKHLVDYRNDPDIFVLIDVPTNIIDERIKYRVICPQCNTSRNVKLLPTKNVQNDKEKNQFYLMCDNPACLPAEALAKEGAGPRMVTKEGDLQGIEPIRSRLEKDELLMSQIQAMHGISKILLRNSIPKEKTTEFADDYEITPEYHYTFNESSGKVEVLQKSWEVLDDQGVASNSLMPPPVVVSLIKQLVGVLEL